MTRNILDIHTHHAGAIDALIAVDARLFNPQPGLWYAVGYHPWNEVDTLTDNDFDTLERCARHPQVLAIGETGMDTRRGASLDVQASVFVRHLMVAGSLGLPVIVHCVRTAQEILAQRHKARLDHVTLAIHGMRANERVARTLIEAGCYLSYGIHFNPAALAATPPERLLIETDEGSASIDDVATAVAAAMHLTPQQVKRLAAANASRLLSLPD